MESNSWRRLTTKDHIFELLLRLLFRLLYTFIHYLLGGAHPAFPPRRISIPMNIIPCLESPNNLPRMQDLKKRAAHRDLRAKSSS